MSIPSIVAAGRRLIDTTLLDSGRIQDRTFTRDATGGKKEIWTERQTRVQCRFVTPKDNDPAIVLDSVFGRAEMVLLLARGTIFKEGDRVRNELDSKVWQIVKDLTPASNLQVIVRVGIRAV